MKKDKQILNPDIIRQGDVLLVRIGSPQDAIEALDASYAAATQSARDVIYGVPPAAEPVVLAYGEVTGHKHQFMADSRVSYLGREAGLKISAPSDLKHEEHSTATVQPGIYDMPVQTEWNDDLEPRVVAD